MAQTTDGYLWIGTDKGLTRFDGVTFRIFQQATPESFPIGPVQSMVTDADGNLWILLKDTKILRFRDGRFELGREQAEFGVTAIGRQPNGTVLFSSITFGTLTYSGGRFHVLQSSVGDLPTSPIPAMQQAYDDLSSRLSWATSVAAHHFAEPNSPVVSLAQTSDGRLWLGTQDRGLFYISDGRMFRVGSATIASNVTCLLPLEHGELWIGTEKGLVRWYGARLTQAGVPSALHHVPVRAMIRDHDSNIWVGTAKGLVRVNGSGVVLDKNGNETSEPVVALFEDREGNLWVGRAGRVERLRDTPFVTYSVTARQSQSHGPIYVDQEGQAWFAPFEGGLHWLNEAKSGIVVNDGLNQDVVYSIAGSKNELWIGRQQGGLTHLRYDAGSITTKTYSQADGLAQNSVFAVYRSQEGAVWVGTLNGGISELRNGRFTNYTTANGLASNTVSSIAESTDGTIWFGTPSGLSAMSKNGWRTYTVKDGLPSEDVNCLLQDSTGALWVGTANGLAFLGVGRVHVPRAMPESLHDSILGIAEDKGGWLWIATASHVLRVRRSSLIEGALSDDDIREYGIADGLRGTEGVKRYRSVVEDSRGQVWFSTTRGLSVVNPARAAMNPVAALIHIESVLADGSPVDLRRPIRISARQQRTTFRFTGLSLANPERVRYRYRLDGFDRDWSEPVATPEATYANLGPGPYRFRVLASNSDGLWNGSEVALGFAVEPTIWQTWWFRLTLVLGVGLATLVAYRLRTRELARLLNVRFEERLAERTRIAQDLHDNLLQGVLSASMQLHVAMDQAPDDTPARATMNQVLQLMGRVVEEGRNTLRGLRSSTENAFDLTTSFSRIPQELGNQEGIDFRVVVEGVSLPLRSAIRDDVYSIGREALVNAFRHSRARNIEVQLEYGRRRFRILVRDDGCGIDPHVLASGRDGHRGLPGMRERAEKIGARLKVLTREGGGTEVELRVPGDIAFESRTSISGLDWLTSLYRRNRNASSGTTKPRVG